MTTSLAFTQVDAFTTRAFGGNQAGVIPLDAWLDDAVLQAIANENNVAETAFTIPAASGDADYELRWFTPTVEVAMCGHATLAAGHVLLGRHPDRDRLRFATRKAGVLEVARSAGGYTLDLPAWTTAPADIPEVAMAMGGKPIELRRNPDGYSIAVYATAAEVRALIPDFRALARHGDTLHIATAPGDGDTDVVSRVFAPAAGIDEDPVTGSAHTMITTYWAEKLGRDRFTAFQASARGGRLDCALVGDRVLLGGGCVTVIEGRFSF